MARKVTPAQYNAMVRRAQQKQRQAINKVNQEIRKHNQDVRRQDQKRKQAINKYNSAVRTHNSRARTHNNRLKAEISRLNSQASSARFKSSVRSAYSVASHYERMDERANTDTFSTKHNELLDLSEREAANSAASINALMGEPTQVEEADNPKLMSFLASISLDSVDRWKGAVFALNPQNPDAARHFCTSAREVIIQILDKAAPNSVVEENFGDCEYTDRGDLTRRTKLKYLLNVKNISDNDLAEFIDVDIDDVLSLFKVFNDGTHGTAGKYNSGQLSVIKKRVEDCLGFISKVTS